MDPRNGQVYAMGSLPNFDPNIFKYYNAIKSGDTTEQQAIVKQLGGLNSKGYNAMMQKAQNLQKLSNSGSLE